MVRQAEEAVMPPLLDRELLRKVSYLRPALFPDLTTDCSYSLSVAAGVGTAAAAQVGKSTATENSQSSISPSSPPFIAPDPFARLFDRTRR